MNPTNIALIETYDRLCNIAINTTVNTIYIFPIPCIEYIVCMLFKRYDLFDNFTLVDCLLDNLKWVTYLNLLDRDDKSSLFKTNKLEDAYKNVLSQQNYCKRNLKKCGCASFYLNNCKSENCHECKNLVKPFNLLESKSKLLFTSLPIFSIPNLRYARDLNKLGIYPSLVSTNCVYNYLQNLYNEFNKIGIYYDGLMSFDGQLQGYKFNEDTYHSIIVRKVNGTDDQIFYTLLQDISATIKFYSELSDYKLEIMPNKENITAEGVNAFV